MKNLNMGKLMKQAKQLQAQMERMQAELAERTVEASVGGGMVTAVANGRQQIVSIKIEPQVVDPNDKDMLEDLVLAAVNEALKKAQEMIQSEMGSLAGGLGGGGLDLSGLF